MSKEYVVPHHYDNAEQAYDSTKMGVWLFLISEILLFGALFIGYIVYRNLYPELFLEASKYLDTTMGAINTAVLITSSFTMAMAVNETKKNRPKVAAGFLFVTLVCAAVFMVIKYFEYTHKFHIGLLPGQSFSNPDFQDPNGGLFFSIYFMMTGLHGFHVVVGILLITWVLIKCLKQEVGEKFFAPVEGVGLYWHLVDLIWIYLFPLMYLID